MQPDPLLQLRDVMLPPAPAFWPPAVGWWVLMVLIIIGLGVIVYLSGLIYRRYRRQPLVAQLDALTRLQPQQSVVELSILMRRIAMTQFQRRSVAGLSGAAWLQFLDESGGTNQFTCGPGQVLASAPYAAVPPAQIEPLFDVCRSWVINVTG